MNGADTTIKDTLREVMISIDILIYDLVSFLYDLFFNLVNFEFISADTTRDLFFRIQLILAIIIIFKLFINILNSIVTPDKFSDKKSGFGNIITRVVISLFVLSMIIPLNIPGAEADTYEAQVNNNGILFGTLFELQDRILYNNTIGTLILGRNYESDDLVPVEAYTGDNFAADIFKAFYIFRPSSDPEVVYDKNDISTFECAEKVEDDNTILRLYESGSIEAMAYNITETCEGIDEGDSENKQNVYIYDYTPFWSGIVGIVIIFIMIGYCLDIVIRTIKLTILRLIAPIPTIMYIDPTTGSKTFSTWVNSLVTTYLDLFLRLIIIFLGLFLIDEVINANANNSLGIDGLMLDSFTFIAVIIGIFIFMGKAPKFIRDILGLKAGDSSVTGAIGKVAASVGKSQGKAVQGGIGGMYGYLRNPHHAGLSLKENLRNLNHARREGAIAGKNDKSGFTSMFAGKMAGRNHAQVIQDANPNAKYNKMNNGQKEEVAQYKNAMDNLKGQQKANSANIDFIDNIKNGSSFDERGYLNSRVDLSNEEVKVALFNKVNDRYKASIPPGTKLGIAQELDIENSDWHRNIDKLTIQELSKEYSDNNVAFTKEIESLEAYASLNNYSLHKGEKVVEDGKTTIDKYK